MLYISNKPILAKIKALLIRPNTKMRHSHAFAKMTAAIGALQC